MNLNDTLKQVLDLFEEKESKKSEAEGKKADKKDLDDKIEEKEGEIAEILSNAIAVAMSQVENLVGMHFENVSEAERFYKQFAQLLKNKRRSELLIALRRFERLGGARTQAIYRRGLGQ